MFVHGAPGNPLEAETAFSKRTLQQDTWVDRYGSPERMGRGDTVFKLYTDP